MDAINWIIDFAILYLCFQYIVGPIMVWRSLKFPEAYKFTPLDTNTFLSERSAIFRQLHAQIQDNNFNYVGSSELQNNNPPLYFSLYSNNETQLACTLVTTYTNSEQTTHIEFTQMYDNGSVLNVSNAAINGVFPKTKMKLAFRYPNINNVKELLAIAYKLIKNNKTLASKISVTKGDEFSDLEKFSNNELKHLIKKGLLNSRVKEDKRNLTIKGSIYMTWKMLWPLKQILNKKNISDSKRALKNA